MDHLQKLVRESMASDASINSRPTLVGLTRATTNLIYHNLVATQPTLTPTASLYGVAYRQEDGLMSAINGATHGGFITDEQRASLKTFPTSSDFALDEFFLVDSVVYKAIVDKPFDGVTVPSTDDLLVALMTNKIRIMADGSQNDNANIAKTKMDIRQWKCDVKSRKLQTSITVELAQNLESAGFDATELVNDLLATQMAEEVNKQIIQSLITVSTRHVVKGITDNGILDLSKMIENNTISVGRLLYQYICEMNSQIETTTTFTGTYVVASSRAASYLQSSGFMNEYDDEDTSDGATGLLNNGLSLYTDPNSQFDYVLVGVKDEYGELEGVGSLYYCPYFEGLDEDNNRDGVGTFKVVVDNQSLHPSVMLMMRYGISVNPYTLTNDVANADNQISGDNLDKLSGQSKMSVILGVKLPEIVKV